MKIGTLKCAVWALGLSCETPAAPPDRVRRGSHTTARELQTCTFQGPCASNTTKIPRKRPKDRGKRIKNCGGRGKKKSAKFWAPPPFGAPPFGASTFSGFGPPSFGPHYDTKNIGIGQNWIGQNWSNQDGQNGIGQSRSLPPAGHRRLLALHLGQSSFLFNKRHVPMFPR